VHSQRQGDAFAEPASIDLVLLSEKIVLPSKIFVKELLDFHYQRLNTVSLYGFHSGFVSKSAREGK